MISLKNNVLECRFDEDTGMLSEVLHGGMKIQTCGLDFDFGADGKMVNGLFEYGSMLDFRTWNLPGVKPTGKAFGLKPVRLLKEEDRLTAIYETGPAEVSMRAKLLPEALEVSILLKNTTDRALYLNTLAFRLSLPDASGVSFEFPGSAPIGRFELKDMKPLQPVEGGLVNFATRIKLPEGGLNFLFIDPVEKWASAGYRDGGSACFVYDAALEADLAPGESLEVGNLYLLLTAKASEKYSGDGSPYLQIRRFVESLGFQPAEDGIRDGVMYSCHPSGTMDAGFPFKTDLFQYAEELPKLRDMGIDHIWLLPVFEHDENGVYHSTDQSVIDPRYGGEEGCRYFCKKAHELGMTVLFDYVPHGPAADFPLVKAHPDWPSKKRDGSMQEEWECVSMDYNHPGYQEYTTELVEDHVRRFSIDGARIDCAMGGLSNWRPYPGNRPSGNSVLAGVHITEAIREGFLKGGKRPLNLPENFYLIPNYYHCTDVFYGMNLYRAFAELEPLLKENPADYVVKLTDFLEQEAMITPENYHKMRFLGNHDTVSWVWQSKRAQDIYGTEAAKALFALIALIDGVPMIYQGDEDPALARKDGEDLTAFFKELFADRKKYIPKGSNRTTYLHTLEPIMAFVREAVPADENDENASPDYRTEGEKSVLVLINLSPETEKIVGNLTQGRLLKDSAGAADPAEPIAPYAYRIVEV